MNMTAVSSIAPTLRRRRHFALPWAIKSPPDERAMDLPHSGQFPDATRPRRS